MSSLDQAGDVSPSVVRVGLSRTGDVTGWAKEEVIWGILKFEVERLALVYAEQLCAIGKAAVS